MCRYHGSAKQVVAGIFWYLFFWDWNYQGRDRWAQYIFYLPETLQTSFLNCLIDLLTCQESEFNVKRFPLWRACDEESACEYLLTWYLYMRSFCSGSPLIFHSRYQQYSPWSGKTTNIWICPISTSDIPSPCINIKCTFHSRSSFCSSHNSSSCYHQWCGW